MIDQYERKLNEFIRRHGVAAEHLHFDVSCHSVADAARAVGADAADFVKNICMIGNNGRVIVAVVKGEDRVSAERVASVRSIPRPRLAVAPEILERTGYPCGGTPSFGFDATFLVDARVMEREVVYSGGGSAQSLVKIATKELVRVNAGIIAHIRT